MSCSSTINLIIATKQGNIYTVRLPVYTFISLSVYPSICLFVCLSVCLSVCMSVLVEMLQLPKSAHPK